MTNQISNNPAPKIAAADRLLLLGALIPIVFIGFVLLVRGITEQAATPPAYKVMIAEVEDGSLHAFDTKLDGRNLVLTYKGFSEYKDSVKIKIHTYDPTTNTDSVDTHEIKAPEEVKPDDKKVRSAELRLTLPEGLTLNTNDKSPDGYEYLPYGNRSDSNIYGELFGANRNSKATLQGNVANFTVELQGIKNARYYNTEFVGWLIPESPAQ